MKKSWIILIIGILISLVVAAENMFYLLIPAVGRDNMCNFGYRSDKSVKTLGARKENEAPCVAILPNFFQNWR